MTDEHTFFAPPIQQEIDGRYIGTSVDSENFLTRDVRRILVNDGASLIAQGYQQPAAIVYKNGDILGYIIYDALSQKSHQAALAILPEDPDFLKPINALVPPQKPEPSGP